jgi:hypothetical protein
MANLEFITSEEARARLLVVYRRSGDSVFLETLQRPFLNPIEQRDQVGRRKIHPLLIVGMVLLAIAIASAAFFTVRT